MWRASMMVMGLLILSVSVGLSIGDEKPKLPTTQKPSMTVTKKPVQTESATSRPTRRTKVAPFKVFVPSKTIAVDQTVDFPSDI